jgi:hypothetical protein
MRQIFCAHSPPLVFRQMKRSVKRPRDSSEPHTDMTDNPPDAKTDNAADAKTGNAAVAKTDNAAVAKTDNATAAKTDNATVTKLEGSINKRLRTALESVLYFLLPVPPLQELIAQYGEFLGKCILSFVLFLR